MTIEIPQHPNGPDIEFPTQNLSLPETVFGMSVSWDRDYSIVAIPVSEIQFGRKGILHLYRAELDLAQTAEKLFGGDATFSVFVARWCSDAALGVSLLCQQRTVFFVEAGLEVVGVPAGKTLKVLPKDRLRPTWKTSEALWPTVDDDNLQFLGKRT